MSENSLLSAPEGALILFDGSHLDQWTKRGSREPAAWPVEDGSMVTRGGDIVTWEKFEDCYLHVEFLCPDLPSHVTGQGRSNSGVFLQGRYEIQVLDSWGRNPPGRGDCGALYNMAAPLVNASKRPDEWQAYDIFFRAPRFDRNGRKTENARVTVLHNGIVIHNNVEAATQTGGALNEDYADPGPILLQDHGNAVRYRSVWIVPLLKEGSETY